MVGATIGGLAAVLIALINGLFGMCHTESPPPTVILVPVDSRVLALDPSWQRPWDDLLPHSLQQAEWDASSW